MGRLNLKYSARLFAAVAALAAAAPVFAQDTTAPATHDQSTSVAVRADAAATSAPVAFADDPTTPGQALPRPTMSLPTTARRIGEGWAHKLSLVGIFPDEFYRGFLVPEFTEADKRELNARNHFFMGHYYLIRDEAVKALGEFRAALESDPGNVRIQLAVASAEATKRDLPAALKTVNGILADSPQQVDALVFKGKILSMMAQEAGAMRRRDLQNQAVAAFQEVKRLQPRNLEALGGLANLYIAQQNVDRMVETYREILLADPRNTRAMLILAQVLSRTGKSEEAIAFYERVIEQRRGFINTYIYLGQLYEELNRPDDALATYETAILIEPRNPQLVRLFDEAVRKAAGNKGAAEVMRRYEAFAKKYPHSGEVQRIFAEQLVSANEFDKAVRQYKRVLELDAENVDAMVAIGNILLNRKRYDEATEFFSKAVDLNPEKVEIYDSIAASLLSRNERDRAVEMYEKALSLNPKADKLYTSLAALHESGGELDKALEVLSRGVERAGELPELLVSLGAINEKHRRFDEAAKQYEKALRLVPDNRTVLVRLLNTMVRGSQQDRIPELVDSVTSGSEEDPGDVYLLVGETLMADAQVGGAIQYYEKAIDAAPGKLVPYVRLARALSLQKRFDEALALLNKATPLFRGSEELRMLEAEIHADRGDHDKAIEIYRRMVADKPDAMDGYRLLVDALSRAERGEEALQMAKQAEARLGKTEDVDAMRGIALYQMKRYDAAEKVFRDLTRRSARNADTYFYFLGSIALEQKKYDTARRHLEKAIDLNPTNDSALNALGYMLADQGKELPRAKELIEQALALNPGAPHILDSMGWVLFKMGEKEEALEYLERAAALIGEDAEVYDHLGDVYRAMGDVNKALEYWRKSISLDKNRDSVQAKIKADETKATE